MFDGVHLGHQFVLRHVAQTACERGLASMAITFDAPADSRKPILTPLDEKLTLLQTTGIDRVEVLTFNEALRLMTAREFMQQVLRDRLGVHILLTGYDNRFGHNREEGFEDYVRYGRELGIEVLQLPAEGEVSSSLIRNHITAGRVAEAARSLGHPYTVAGRVEHGEHIGTRLGFPTANIEPACRQQLLPAPGVYAVRVLIGNVEFGGMMNIGSRPTFGIHEQTLEVNLFHFEDNLYCSQLTVAFVARLRNEHRFDSAESLKAQLHADALQAAKVLDMKI